MSLHVVLVEPEIPQNTGNIARTCAAVGASLHLIEPLGFSLEDRYLKRAGLDYWDLVVVQTHPDLESYRAVYPGNELVYATKKIGKPFSEFDYPERCSLVFGKETAGLPEALLEANAPACVRIPMKKEARSLNLSNAAAVLVYEVYRRRSFPGLDICGPGL